MTMSVLAAVDWGSLAVILVVLCALMLPVSLVILVAVALTKPGFKARWWLGGGLVLGVFGLVMLPQVNMFLPGAPKPVCHDNLVRIGRVCLAYASEHAGRLPADKHMLFQLLGEDASALVCLKDELFLDLRVMPAESARRLVLASPSYVYVGGYNLQDVAGFENNAILAYGRAAHHDSVVGLKHRGVVFADGQVAYYVERSFHEALTRHDAVMKHARSESVSRTLTEVGEATPASTSAE